MFTFISRGMTRFVSGPAYGRQDQGYSPSGALDDFAMRTGNLMLGNPEDTLCLEIVLLPPRIEFQSPTMFILTGAACEAVLISRDGKLSLDHATVYRANPGDILMPGEVHYGFRTYLCFREGEDPRVIGRVRQPFTEIARWIDPERRIRVLCGPEYSSLENPGVFLEGRWTVSAQSSDIGIRLGGPELTGNFAGMVSAPVSDGTIQLSPAGPIVLLRNRPTIGGYPRIFNVISADVDVLAQYAPGNVIHFREVDRAEAVRIARRKREDIEEFRKRVQLADYSGE